MQISTKGRYALRFLLDLCQRQDEGSISLKSIAERQDISKKYLERIISMLSSSGMLTVSRGYQGGYQLAKSPAEISIADVLRITEGGLAPVPDPENDSYMTIDIWKGLEDVITDYLEGITLQDVIDAHGPLVEYYI
ncbi:MAG: Rrf2 family transcriptional regulator [Coriobacteriaceae bacterium]|jgi:Rrf2 family protein|nr:Rrf2 family transcriptional regulator [Coriobacteriaceae bacterium]